MRIVIIGAGAAGQQLARRLCNERHDVVIVDRNPAALAELEAQLDVLTITGPGASPATLREAEVAKADLVVAVTNQDEVNILAGLLAHAAGVTRKVVRISDTDFIHGTGPFDLKPMGIDLVVSQKEECAHDLFNVLRLPGTIEVVDVLDEHAVVAGIKIDMDGPLAMATLGQFPEPDLIQRIRFIAHQRNGKVEIPRGDSQFMIGDDVYFVGEPGIVADFLRWAYPQRTGFERVVIAGGGDLGFHLAELLEQNQVETIILEPDERQAEYCADRLGRALVLRVDPLEPESFEEAGVAADTAFVAATEDDENNIICCLLAEKRGASFTAAQIAKTGYAPVINSLSLLDRAVNPYTSMINAISRFIRGAHIAAAANLYSLPGEILEVQLPPESPWANQSVAQIGALRQAIISAVMRAGEVIPATGDLVLQAGDRLVLFAQPKAAPRVLSRMRG